MVLDKHHSALRPPDPLKLARTSLVARHPQVVMRLVEDPALGIDHEAKAALFDALADVAGALAAGRRAENVDLLVRLAP